MDGPLLRYVTDYQGLSDEYDFDDLAAKSSEIMTKVSLPNTLVFTYIYKLINVVLRSSQ
jgi:hypothetical protein